MMNKQYCWKVIVEYLIDTSLSVSVLDQRFLNRIYVLAIDFQNKNFVTLSFVSNVKYTYNSNTFKNTKFNKTFS